MRLDFDLVRLILLEIEKSPANRDPDTVKVPGFDEDTVLEHLAIMAEKGLIDAEVIEAGSGDQRVVAAFVKRMTWEGHEFLDNARNDEVWSTTKKVVKEKGGSVSFDIFTAILTQVALNLFRLG
ncbi:MAG TPA: DUF2513 domain-containing protein [Longimicrobiaceae bacterium]